MDTIYGIIFWAIIIYYFYNRRKKKKMSENVNVKTPVRKENSENNIVHQVDNIDGVVVQKTRMPEDIAHLLWFSNGKYKNYDPDSVGNTIDTGLGISFKAYMNTDIEPSLIDITLPIKKPHDLMFVEALGYWPRYENLNPEQRWVYLSWLQNIEISVDIGYVFLFYYGLERHLFLGDIDAAFDMILRLNANHNNNSFHSYSTNALLGAILYHKRSDLLEKFLLSTSNFVISELYLFVKLLLDKPLLAEEIIALSSKVGFTNKRYIKSDYELFIKILKKEILEQTGSENLSWQNLDIDQCPMIKTTLTANQSISPREISIPDVMQDYRYKTLVNKLLKSTHEKVKVELRELRKKV
ncbi:MAG: TerB N-terminal domain-containing protein [Deferribacterales bacterium]